MAKANEVSNGQWIYDLKGKGRFCDSRQEAQTLINTGEYSDHPNGTFEVREEAEVESAETSQAESMEEKFARLENEIAEVKAENVKVNEEIASLKEGNGDEKTDEPPVKNLNKMNLAELTAHCESLSITVPIEATKAELKELIANHEG